MATEHGLIVVGWSSVNEIRAPRRICRRSQPLMTDVIISNGVETSP